MCVPTDDYKSMKQFIMNIGEYLMAKVKSKKVVEYIWKLTEDEVGAIQSAMMSSDYFHSDSLSDQAGFIPAYCLGNVIPTDETKEVETEI